LLTSPSRKCSQLNNCVILKTTIIIAGQFTQEMRIQAETLRKWKVEICRTGDGGKLEAGKLGAKWGAAGMKYIFKHNVTGV